MFGKRCNIFADKGIISLKHDVINEVAKLAFEGKLEEKRDTIPYSIIPGPQPQFRCCIYKERAIVSFCKQQESVRNR